MYLSKKQISQLIKVLETTQQILADASQAVARGGARDTGEPKATRRRGKDLTSFKKMIKAERKSGVSVAELARKHGVTPSYIYQLR